MMISMVTSSELPDADERVNQKKVYAFGRM